MLAQAWGCSIFHLRYIPYFQIAAKINQPGQGSGDGINPSKRPIDDPNNFGEYQKFSERTGFLSDHNVFHRHFYIEVQVK